MEDFEDLEDEELSREEAKTFMGIAARLNFLSLDCPGLQFPTKNCSREMARPTRGSWAEVR